MDREDVPDDNGYRKAIREASARVRQGKKNIFNVAAAHAANPKTKKPILLPQFSWDKKPNL